VDGRGRGGGRDRGSRACFLVMSERRGGLGEEAVAGGERRGIYISGGPDGGGTDQSVIGRHSPYLQCSGHLDPCARALIVDLTVI
jgi:hypothetical protein